MTQAIESIDHTDPEGSLFLSKNSYVERFLALDGDPVELVAEILANGNAQQTLNRLQFSLLQSRGMEKIKPDVTEEELVDEVEKRALFYDAVMRGLELLASDQAV